MVVFESVTIDRDSKQPIVSPFLKYVGSYTATTFPFSSMVFNCQHYLPLTDRIPIFFYLLCFYHLISVLLLTHAHSPISLLRPRSLKCTRRAFGRPWPFSYRTVLCKMCSWWLWPFLVLVLGTENVLWANKNDFHSCLLCCDESPILL